MPQPRLIELLSPARDAATAISAITHGADAVYMGPERFGARASAGNTLADLARVAEFAHRYDARLYATVNTILMDHELADAERLIRNLYHIGVDALIVQDMGILRLDIPPIALHASTQCDTRTPEKARFLQDVGFSQIVLARELTVEEIKRISDVVDVALECFVHGALCVSYSGRCHASCAYRRRSANRGECAQICRQAFSLTDGNEHTLFENKHLLSLRDFNQSDNLEALLDAGVSSLKIEGRLKDVAYVKNVTAYYNNLLNSICDANPQKFKRLSAGKSQMRFTPDPAKSFNRGFTHYFFNSRKEPGEMSSPITPKSIGTVIGTVKHVSRNFISIDTSESIANGDGLLYVDKHGEVKGFRANKADGNKIFPQEKIDIPAGTVVRRNFDKAFNDTLLSDNSAERKIAIDIRLRATSFGIAADITALHGPGISVAMAIEKQSAAVAQTATQMKVFGKLGNTTYVLHSFSADTTSQLFIPASQLTALRRKAVETLDRAFRIAHRYDYRRKEDKSAIYPSTTLTYADNVANRKATTFYNDHGVSSIEPAMERSGKATKGNIVMTTRFCLRREYGCCLLTPSAKKWKEPLTLTSGNISLNVDFDCRNCQMILKIK